MRKMKCPKCGGEIPFLDLRPNCRHCGVNIMYFTQEDDLVRDAKRTELEGAVARMVVARVKAAFIGSKLAIVRLVVVLIAIAALLVPFGAVSYNAPYFQTGFSAGIIGIVQAFTGGLFMQLPKFLASTVFSPQTIAAAVPTAFLVICALIDVISFTVYLLSFLNLTKGTKIMRNLALVGACVALAGQIASLVVNAAVPDTSAASVSFGFGGLAACVMFLVLFFVNRTMLKKGIEPVYRENDLKRKELLKQVRKGEVNLDDLPLPVFENEQERQERLKALEEALIAEEEGKEL